MKSWQNVLTSVLSVQVPASRASALQICHDCSSWYPHSLGMHLLHQCLVAFCTARLRPETILLLSQILTKAGILNVPDWFDAGKVSIQNSFAPFSKSATLKFSS